MTTTRDRILDAAQLLLDDGGLDAMSTRGVSAAAGVQAPAIYRLFQDKQGLLDAVTERRLDEYVAEKVSREPLADPVADLRRGWDLHVGFGLAHPAVYAAVFGSVRAGPQPPAMRRSDEVLLAMMRRIAAAGRLRVDEQTAARVAQGAGRGTTLLLLATPPTERDLRVSEIAREAVIAAVTTDAAPSASGEPVAVAARTVGAALPDVDVLSDAEKGLMAEWLDRITVGREGG